MKNKPTKRPEKYSPQHNHNRDTKRAPQNVEDNPLLREDVVIGRAAVLELLKSGREVECVYVTASQEARGSITAIVAIAHEKGLLVKEVSPVKLEYMAAKQNHQGVVAVTAAAKYSEIDDIFAKAGNQPPFILILDEISDPHNLGAIARTAEAAGAHGIIIPKRGAVGLTATVFKTSAGAIEHIPVVRVPNIVATIKELKARGVWVYAADMDGRNWHEQNYEGAVALVIGSEGAGIGRLIKEHCDFTVSLPMYGEVNSLNASVAAGILMYEIARQHYGAK